MARDLHGHILSEATAAAADHYQLAVEAFNLYRGDPMSHLTDAIAAAPAFAMAHILRAHLLALSSEPAATQQAKAFVAEIKALPLTEREAAHVRALDLVIAGEWTAAGLLLDRHSMTFPRDLVALQVGHLIDFYHANARALRDRIARVLPSWSSAMPGYSILLGFRAFGLEEAGDYARAEDVGREAVELQPLDCWAHHAVAHVMEMRGRAEDGIRWMMTREPYWSGDANFFKVHNWWHRALYHLDLGEIDDVLALYDGPIRKDCSAVVLDMIDASALLWRLHLSGQDTGNRWTELAAAWDAHADGNTYPFNDWHAAMAYLGAGRMNDVVRLVRTFQEAGDSGREATSWGKLTAVPLIEGFSAFWRGDYAAAVQNLHGARYIANSFGGSNAQRDIIDLTLTEAATRGGLRDVARALAAERIANNPRSATNQSFILRNQ